MEHVRDVRAKKLRITLFSKLISIERASALEYENFPQIRFDLWGELSLI